MGKFLDQKDEWEMIAEKGKKWMKKNLPGAVKYDNMLECSWSSDIILNVNRLTTICLMFLQRCIRTCI